jgi:hypothetical protein
MTVMKLKIKKLKIKNIIVVSLVLLFSAVALYLVVERPAFLFKGGGKSYEEDFVLNYEENIPDDWQIIEITDLGLISIPKTLEVREDGSTVDVVSTATKAVIYKLSNITEPNAESNLVIQQKGLNEASRESFSSYARVMINIHNLEEGSFPKRYEKFNLSDDDLEEIKDQSMETLNQASAILDVEIRDTTIEEVQINRMSAIRFTLIRSLKGNPEVYLEQYKFFNDNQMVEIILSYRINESEKWAEDFSKIINTFIITN